MASSSFEIERRAQMFPRLDAGQIARIERLAKRRRVEQGELLVDVGARTAPFFVLLSGEIEIVRLLGDREEFIAFHEAGEFTGETNMLSGRTSLFRARVRRAGEVLELDGPGLRHLVQTDAELSEVLMRAFILRRVALIARGQGNVLILGSRHSADTHRIREFLTRNGQPLTYVDVDHDPDVQPLFDRFGVSAADVPLIICRGETLLKNPTTQELAECLGMNPELDASRIHDLIVVGAGPAGLAAAVYAASEGLDVVVIEASAPGGQAGSSSKIENYLGFPTGISGQALAGRAYTQAQKFGAELLVARRAGRLACSRTPYCVGFEGGGNILGRSIVLACGAQYRKLPLAEVTRFEGVGIYYGATHMEAQLCQGEEVIVVGGGNSAGQAAVFLSRFGHVHMLVRSSGLADTMSRYLIQRIEDSPSITLWTHSEIDALRGHDRLEGVSWRHSKTGETVDRPVQHVFLMTGAGPHTEWLEGCVALDQKGFIKTGADLQASDLGGWTAARSPYMLETNLPGVFAVGDVRSGSVKRVASAVGEGSVCVQHVHRVLGGQ